MLRSTLVAAIISFSFTLSRADDVQPADIEFHSAALSFPCRDKTPKEFADVNPDRKIIESTIRVSANFNVDESEVDRIEYRLKMPETFEVSDYLPKTTVGSEIAGPIGIGGQNSSKSLTVVSLDAGAKAGFKIPLVVDSEVTGRVGGKGETAREVGSSVQMSLLPPKQLVTAASTQNAGRTLHFKLKKFNQITLEGDKDFAFLAAVPKDWKGNCFTVECAAFLKGSSRKEIRTRLTLGLYASGDLAMKRQVEATAKASHPTISTNRKPATPSDDTPKAVAPPANTSLEKYAGKYSCYYALGLTLHFDLRNDGTYVASGKAISGATSSSRGVWSATDDKLIITCKHEKTIVYDLDFNVDLINSNVSSFDEKRRIIRTESNYELKGE